MNRPRASEFGLGRRVGDLAARLRERSSKVGWICRNQGVGVCRWRLRHRESKRLQVGLLLADRAPDVRQRLPQPLRILPYCLFEDDAGHLRRRLRAAADNRPRRSHDHLARLCEQAELRRFARPEAARFGAFGAGSVVAATFNCRPDREDERLDALIRAVGTDFVPGDVDEDALGRDGLPRAQRRILVEQLDAAASARTPPAHLQQFMFVRYADRTPMIFWAGLIVDESIEEQVAALPPWHAWRMPPSQPPVARRRNSYCSGSSSPSWRPHSYRRWRATTGRAANTRRDPPRHRPMIRAGGRRSVGSQSTGGVPPARRKSYHRPIERRGHAA